LQMASSTASSTRSSPTPQQAQQHWSHYRVSNHAAVTHSSPVANNVIRVHHGMQAAHLQQLLLQLSKLPGSCRAAAAPCASQKRHAQLLHVLSTATHSDHHSSEKTLSSLLVKEGFPDTQGHPSFIFEQSMLTMSAGVRRFVYRITLAAAATAAWGCSFCSW